jgi:ABC-type transport system substrate-binding protein
MKKKMTSLALATALAASLVSGAAVANAEEASETLHVALTNSFTGAGAINTANPYRFATLSQVYESLLTLTENGYESVLLKEWEMTEPGVWNLTLYDGITDSEGNPFTSDDLKWALNAQKEAGNDIGRYYDTDCIEVIDDTHCTLNLSTDSEGTFYLIATQLLLCTEEAYEGSDDHLATMPIGTGPYVCTSYVEGSSATLEKRADYWKTEDLSSAEAANFDTIEISYVSEATQMAIAIEDGSVEFAGQVSMSISGDVDAVEEVNTMYVTNGTYNGISFNMSGREISENTKLREAIAYAIDPQGLIAAVYQGHAQEMTTYGMDTCIDFDESWVKNFNYDPEVAMEKLAESGYDTSKEIVLLANNVGEDSQIAELVQGYLAGIGLTVTMDYVDPATQTARIAEGNWDLNLSGGSGVLDMSLFWGNLYSKLENGMSKYFHNDAALYDIFDVYNEIGGKTDENRQALYEYESSNYTWLPLFNKQVLYAMRGYNNIVVNDAYMSLPYLGTLN